MEITLQQHETISALLDAYLRRGDCPMQGREAILAWFMREWRLFDACVDAVGYDVSEGIGGADAGEIAALILHDAEVIDEHAADYVRASA